MSSQLFMICLLFLLCLHVVQASTEKEKQSLKRKRKPYDTVVQSSNRIEFEPEAFDVIHHLRRLLTTTIKKIIQPHHTSTSFYPSDTIADTIYHQSTTYELILGQRALLSTPAFDFVTGNYITTNDPMVYTFIVTSPYLKYLPDDVFDSAYRYVRTPDWLVLRTTEPLYHHADSSTASVVITIPPAVGQVTVELTDCGIIPIQRFQFHSLPPESFPASRRLENMDVVVDGSLDTLNLGGLASVRTLAVWLPHHKYSTDITLPAVVETVNLTGTFSTMPGEPIRLTVAVISHELRLEYITLSACRGVAGKVPALVFVHVHFLHATTVQWPTVPVDSIYFHGGSWPDAGLNLAIIPFVATLQFRFLLRHSRASLRRFVFPAVVTAVIFHKFSLPLLTHLRPANFPHTISQLRFIQPTLREINTVHVTKLCQLILRQEQSNEPCQEQINTMIEQQRRDQTVHTEWWVIDVTQVKANLSSEK